MHTALVTGGSGFVAGHLVALLAAEGYRVHATVRDPDDPAKTEGLRAVVERHPGQVETFAADLLTEGSFDEAIRGCDVVFHVASPFPMAEQIGEPYTDVVRPALEGTRNVLASVEHTPTVERVVLTSTIGAMFGDYSDVLDLPGHVLTEDVFNTSSSLTRSPYHYSKVLAEREAREVAGRQSRWSLVAINPGLVLGPALTGASVSGSLFLLDEVMSGKLWFGVPDISFAPVDVRDVALAHLRAAVRPEAHGRYIVSHREMIGFLDIARIIKQVHRRPWLVPRNGLPKALLRVVGPAFGLDGEFIDNHVGIRFTLDNARSIDELGVTYRPVTESLHDHYEAWAARR